MLKKLYRISAAKRLKNPNVFRSSFFIARFEDSKQGVSRFGFVVRKTIDKRAVVRNRIKRLFRSCIEEELLNIKPGFDMLFFVEKGIIGKTREEICAELKSFLLKKNLLISNN